MKKRWKAVMAATLAAAMVITAVPVQGPDSTSGNKVKKDYAVKEDLCDQQTQQSKAVSKVQS